MFASLKNRLKRSSSKAASQSGYGPDKDSLRYKISNWLLTAPRATTLLALSATLLTCLIALVHIHLHGESQFTTQENEPALVFVYLRSFYFLGLGLLFPVLILCFLRHRIENLVVSVSIASLAAFAVWVASEIILWQPSSHLYHSGVAPALIPELFRYLLCAGLILSPPVLVVLFRRAPILDRYLLRQFLGPFILCSVGILAVWIIVDLQDNFTEFFDANVSLGTILNLYIIQLPQMIVLILPATLLLGLLYSLAKMSKSNELVSMLSSGRSLVSILSPLIFVGIYLSLFCLALNYEWAPQAQAHKDSILQDIDEQSRINKGKKKKRKTVIKASDIAIARNQMYEHSDGRRLWRIGYIPLDLSQKKMSGVEIYIRNEDGVLTKSIFAEKAGWNHVTGEWFLRSNSRNPVTIFDYTQLGPNNTPLRTTESEHIESGWTETPWNIVSEHLVADHLGVPGLGFHLRANEDKASDKLAPFRAHWHYRWALPWNCFVVILFGAPLGIGLSRRGVLGGIAAAICLLGLLIVFGHLFLVLAQSQIVPPFIGAWPVPIVFSLVGIYLIYMRSMNKDLPKPSSLFSIFKKSSRDPSPAQLAPTPAMAMATASAAPAPASEHPPTVGQKNRRTHSRSTTGATRPRASEFDLDFD